MSANHHLVTEFYLSAFTGSGTADGSLIVLDAKTPKVWTTTAAKAARERDFCRIEMPEVDPNAVDNALGEFESDVAPIIRRLRFDPQFHIQHDFEMMLNFMALHVVRERSFRKIVTARIESDLKQQVREGTATREKWELDVAEMRKAGIELPPTCTWEGMHKFAREGQYAIEPSNNVHVEIMIDSIDTVLHKLCARAWCIHFVRTGGPSLICSDRPVTLMPRKPFAVGIPIGFGSPGVDVLFPVSKRVMMHGVRDECDLPEVMGRREVAMANSALVAFSDRFLFADEEAFVLLHPDGRLVNGHDLLTSLRIHRDRGRDTPGTGESGAASS